MLLILLQVSGLSLFWAPGREMTRRMLSAQKGFAQNQSDAQKNQNTIQDDEDYIEEDFEEDNSDSPIEDATGADEGDDEEEQRLEQERLEQQKRVHSAILSDMRLPKVTTVPYFWMVAEPQVPPCRLAKSRYN